MKPVNQVYVKFLDNIAGVLSYDEKSELPYKFTYNKNYLSSSRPAVGPNLPKSSKSHKSKRLFPEFESRLFEGPNQVKYCRDYRIDINDQVTQLAMFGQNILHGLSFEAIDEK